ncbi:hypothetical protein EES45_25135 [Streptomyces sp. ADI97-07]|nr:hypothetical protein EES45_25135 [Streptomyces sp. ADI97-07]
MPVLAGTVVRRERRYRDAAAPGRSARPVASGAPPVPTTEGRAAGAGVAWSPPVRPTGRERSPRVAARGVRRWVPEESCRTATRPPKPPSGPAAGGPAARSARIRRGGRPGPRPSAGRGQRKPEDRRQEQGGNGRRGPEQVWRRAGTRASERSSARTPVRLPRQPGQASSPAVPPRAALCAGPSPERRPGSARRAWAPAEAGRARPAGPGRAGPKAPASRPGHPDRRPPCHRRWGQRRPGRAWSRRGTPARSPGRTTRRP